MPKTHIFIPDTQVKPGVDMTYLSAIGEYIAFKKPDVIVHIGDHADMPSLSSYDKGKAAAEGRRYHKDIDAAIEGMDLLVSPIKSAIQKDKKWKPRMVFTNGNHESYSRSTSVFSKIRGWIGVSEVEPEDELAQFSKEGITFAKPIHYTTKPFKGNLLKFKTPTNQFVVTPKHEVVLSDFTKKLAEEVTLQDSLVEPVPILAEEIEQDPLMTKLLTWVVCDGCIPKGRESRPLIQFKLSRQDKIDNLENLLKELKFEYTKRECKKYGINKLQPYYIRIYGDFAREIIKLLDNKKEFGDWVFKLKKENLIALEEALLESDGNEHDNATTLTSIDERSLINLQFAFLKLGYNPSIRQLKGGSGFKNGKTQYNLRLRKSFNNQTPFKIEEVPYDDNVFCFTMPEGTLVTLYEGRLGFSGNCRIQRFAEDNPLMYGKVSLADLQYQKFGWEVHDFLKPVVVDGIAYSHFFANPFSGKPYGGSAANILSKVGQSFSQGHKQTFDVSQRYLPTGERQIGLVAGACLAKHHKVLTADLRYIPLGEVKVGEKLVSFDESVHTSVRRGRSYKTGTVLNVRITKKPVKRVMFSDGSNIIATPDHLMITRTGGQTATRYSTAYTWRRVDSLRKGTRVPKPLDVWETLNTYDSGYLAGLYDGEGCLCERLTSAGTVVQLSFYQKPGIVYEEYCKALDKVCGLNANGTTTNRGVIEARLKGGAVSVAKFLGSVRPHRLLPKFRPELLGQIKSTEGRDLTVVSVEDFGIEEIVEIDIDEKTMIVEGQLHHNCYPWDESYKGYQGNKHFRGLVVKHRVEKGSYDLMQVSLDYLIDRYKNRHNIPKPEYLADEPTINRLMNEILEKNPRVYMMGEKTLHELIQDTTFCSLLNVLSDNLIKELKTRNFIEDISYTNSQELKEVISRGRYTVDGRFVV